MPKECKATKKRSKRLSLIKTEDKTVQVRVTFWDELKDGQDYNITEEDRNNITVLLNESFGSAWKRVDFLIS